MCGARPTTNTIYKHQFCIWYSQYIQGHKSFPALVPSWISSTRTLDFNMNPIDTPKDSRLLCNPEKVITYGMCLLLVRKVYDDVK